MAWPCRRRAHSLRRTGTILGWTTWRWSPWVALSRRYRARPLRCGCRRRSCRCRALSARTCRLGLSRHCAGNHRARWRGGSYWGRGRSGGFRSSRGRNRRRRRSRSGLDRRRSRMRCRRSSYRCRSMSRRSCYRPCGRSWRTSGRAGRRSGSARCRWRRNRGGWRRNARGASWGRGCACRTRQLGLRRQFRSLRGGFLGGQVSEVLPHEFGVLKFERTRVRFFLRDADLRKVFDQDLRLDL